MRSGLVMPLLSFGVIFLSFGGVMVFLGLLGLHFHTRDNMGMAGIVGISFLVIGAVLTALGYMMRRSVSGVDHSRA
jgi:hypothetical protein